ncbi:MAG: hypothetical protein HQL71_06365 [Magnetococcales bacterium]|nr:hypothetical protein [Magnetococcales bacterium]
MLAGVGHVEVEGQPIALVGVHVDVEGQPTALVGEHVDVEGQPNKLVGVQVEVEGQPGIAVFGGHGCHAVLPQVSIDDVQ